VLENRGRRAWDGSRSEPASFLRTLKDMRTCPMAPTRTTPVGLAALRTLTLNHRAAGFDHLARLALPAAAQTALRQRLQQAGLEAVLLSTCNRTELYWHARSADDDLLAEAAFRSAAAAGHPIADATLPLLDGLDSARHLMRVAAGLESLIVGESEILGQVRDAIEQAEREGTAGLFLPTLFHAALRFGGRVRTETRIGQGALSVASASVQLLARVRPDGSARTVVVIGAGVTGLKAARHLRAERVERVVVLNRTLEKAQAAAADLGVEAGPLDDLPRWLAEADAVLAAVHVETPLIRADAIRAARRSRSAPLALLDLSLPRAIDPDCATVEGVVLHDLSGLEQVVAGNRALREREVPLAEAALERELAIFEEQARESAVRPLVAELRRRAEAIRREELERVVREGAVDEAALDRMTRRIVDRLLHGPSAALRRGDLALDSQHVRYLRTILGLTDGMDLAGEAHESP
jgi:glutamyl-tRNA reductase